MTYDIEITLFDKKFNIRNVEAFCEEDAIEKTIKFVKQNIKLASIQKSQPKQNARQLSGEEMYEMFFRKR